MEDGYGVKAESAKKQPTSAKLRRMELPGLSQRNGFLQMSVLLFARVGLQFGEGGVYPELCTRLHGIFFVVLSAGKNSSDTWWHGGGVAHGRTQGVWYFCQFLPQVIHQTEYLCHDRPTCFSWPREEPITFSRDGYRSYLNNSLSLLDRTFFHILALSPPPKVIHRSKWKIAICIPWSTINKCSLVPIWIKPTDSFNK